MIERGISEICLLQVGADQHGARQIGAFELGSLQIAPGQIRVAQQGMP